MVNNDNVSTTTKAIAALLAYALTAQFSLAESDDLQHLATEQCEFGALTVAPHDPWYSVPIESSKAGIEGCQMIWEEDEQYMGIIRLVSFENGLFSSSDVKWENYLVSFESEIMAAMNIQLGETLWRNDSVPIAGEGFANAKALALEARVTAADQVNEAHFIVFEGDGYKYVLSSITPAESVSPEVYAANTGAMGRIMRSLQPRR